MKNIITTLLVFFIAIHKISAAEVIEVPFGPEDANVKVLAVLNKVDPGQFQSDYKTAGFSYLYRDRIFSPFKYKIYIGKMSQRSVDAIVRVESFDRGQAKVFKQILEAELLKNPPDAEARRLERKSHFQTQVLNLIQPSFSVGYNSYDSPFMTGRDTFITSTVYLVTDLVLVGVAYLYVKDKSPRKSMWDNLLNKKGPPAMLNGPDAGTILGALAVTRLHRMFNAVQDTRAHNRMVELEYSFNF